MLFKIDEINKKFDLLEETIKYISNYLDIKSKEENKNETTDSTN